MQISSYLVVVCLLIHCSGMALAQSPSKNKPTTPNPPKTKPSQTEPARSVSKLPASVSDALFRSLVMVRVGNGDDAENESPGLIVKKTGDAAYLLTHDRVTLVQGKPVDKAVVVVDPFRASEKKINAALAMHDSQRQLALWRMPLSAAPTFVESDIAALPGREDALFLLGFKSVRKSNSGLSTMEPDLVDCKLDSFGNGQRVVDGIRVLQIATDVQQSNIRPAFVVDAKGQVLGACGPRFFQSYPRQLVPILELRRLTSPWVRQATFTQTGRDDNGIILNIQAAVCDPLNELKTLQVAWVPADKFKGDFKSDAHRARPLANPEFVKLKQENGSFSGELTLKPVDDAGTGKFIFQLRLTSKTEKTELTDMQELALVPITATRPTSAPAPAPSEEPTSAPPPGRESVVRLPTLIESLRLAGAGRFLVVKLIDLPGLLVIDALKERESRTINLASSQFLFAAGGDTALVYFPANHSFETWDLLSCKVTKHLDESDPRPVTAMVMGSANDDLAFIRRSGGPAGGAAVSGLLDIQALKSRELSGEFRDGSVLKSAKAFYANPDLGFVTACRVAATSFGIYSINGDTGSYKVCNETVDYALPATDGRIYASNGAVIDDQARALERISNVHAYPFVDSPLVVCATGGGELQLFVPDRTDPVAGLGRFPDWIDISAAAPSDRSAPSSYDARLFASAAFQRLYLIPFSNDRVIIRPLDLSQALASSGPPALIVTSVPPMTVLPGQKWRYESKVISLAGGLKFKLQFSPPGMTVSDVGVLEWDVPTSFGPADEGVLLSVADQSGAEVSQRFKLRMRAPPKTGPTSQPGVYVFKFHDDVTLK